MAQIVVAHAIVDPRAMAVGNQLPTGTTYQPV